MSFDGVSGAYIGGNFRYVDDCDIDEMSLSERDNMLEEAFGIIEDLANEMNEVDENVLSEYDNLVVEPELISDGEEGSFHDDSSNVDSEDVEVCQARERRKNVKEGTKDDANRGYQSLTDEIVSDISDNDYNSEDERMATNSTDEECVTYPVFNERTYIKDPKFELGMLFSSAQSFRVAVQKFAIVNRKPVFQCRNFERRIKYKCNGEGCPLRRGFTEGCRPIIGLDGCHLKGSFGGQLLTSIGCDSNDGMYPIAWAVVEAENSETWNWFLNLLAYDVNIINSGGWIFISDRQKGLINALTTVVPNAEYRFYVMNLYRNMYKDHKGVGSRILLWLAVRSTTEFMFNKHMSELKKLSKKCYDWLIEKPMSQWSRAAFRTTYSSYMFVNNHCEVYNNNIREYMDLPVIGLLMGLQKSAMRRIQNRRDKMAKSYAGNPICPNAMRKVNKLL
ncbi:hypothetical protein AgCh_022497 [Apium graveolens]